MFHTAYVVPGYEVYIENEKIKCKFDKTNHGNRFYYETNTDLTSCANLCTSNNGCKFFYFNENNHCELYKRCSNFMAAKYIGTTYKKVIEGKLFPLGICNVFYGLQYSQNNLLFL